MRSEISVGPASARVRPSRSPQSACRRQVSKPPQPAAPSPHEKHEKHETMHRRAMGGARYCASAFPRPIPGFSCVLCFSWRQTARSSTGMCEGRTLAVAVGGPSNTLRRYAPPPSREAAPTRAPAPWRGLSAEPTGGVVRERRTPVTPLDGCSPSSSGPNSFSS